MGNIPVINVSKNDLNAWINAYAAENGVTATVTTDPVDSNLVTVVFTGADGTQSSALQIQTPEIPPVDGSVNVATEVAALSGKLAQMVGEATGQTAPAPVKNTSISQALFSIYDCLKLLMEVEMKQRETDAAMRAQQHSNIAASLMAEAESIRAAADISFNYGLACAIINTVMTVASTAMSLYTTGSTLNEIANSNVGTAKQNVADIKADIEEAKQTQGATMPTDKDFEAAGTTKAELMPESSKLEPKVQEAQTKVDNAESAYNAAKGKTESAEQAVKDAKGNLNDAKGDLKALQDQKPPATPEEIQTAQKKVTDSEAALEKSQGELKTARENESAAKHDFDSAVDNNVSTLQEYKAALERDANGAQQKFEEAYAKLDAKQKAEVDAAEYEGSDQAVVDARNLKKQAELAKQVQNAENSAMAPRLVQGLGLQLDRAKEAVANAQRELLDSPTMARNRCLEQLAQCIGQFGQSLGNLINAVGEQKAEYARSEQKEMEAQQELERAKLEQTNALYEQTQQMINSIIQLLNAIMEAENQSQQQAINV
ncbi:MAG: hypothetical protein MJ138_01490 [Kiritimatiellae bacterium]|nr:hypothetical protein [Kiritimatiellia bacterium]